MSHDNKLKAGTAPVPELLGLPFADSAHPIDANDAAVQQYGYSRQEFLNMTILDLRPAADIPELLRQTRAPRLQGESTAEKWRHRDKNGTVFPVVITSWKLTFHGHQAEMVLARREVDKE